MTENICNQLDCPCNDDGVCLISKKTMWAGFGTKYCAEEMEDMLSYEETEIKGEIK